MPNSENGASSGATLPTDANRKGNSLAANPRSRRIVIAVDMYHGRIPPGGSELLKQSGTVVQNPLEIRLLYSRLNLESLDATDLLVIDSIGYTSDTSFSEAELDAIDKFVAAGGGLLCAGQAWSWVYPSYGNKPVETFPLNVLGARLGFVITGQNIGTPVPLPAAGIDPMTRHGWWPSEIRFASPGYMPLVRDEMSRVMAGEIDHQKGRIVVVGHESMFDGNPRLLLNVLKLLVPDLRIS